MIDRLIKRLIRPLGHERVYLSLYKVADTTFRIRSCLLFMFMLFRDCAEGVLAFIIFIHGGVGHTKRSVFV